MKERIITALLFGAAVIIFSLIGGFIFTLFVLAIATIGMNELLKMKKLSLFSLPGLLSMLLMWSLFIPNDWLETSLLNGMSKIELSIFIVILLLLSTVITKNKFSFDEVGFIVISATYVGFGFHYFMMTRHIPEDGLAILFFIIFTIWATDSGAYFVGRTFGKRKLSPIISPNKTIEGSLGGIGTALLIGIIFQLVYPTFDSWLTVFIVTIVTSICGQLGDLIESAFKRHFEVKDSGNILPGHGGILDRFDSLLYVMPILHILKLIF